jgi:hypothetical protein
MESIIRDVPALDQTHRRSLEALLGHELADNQRVYIAVLPDSTAPTAEQRQRAWDQLQQIAAKAEANLRAQGISAEQWAAIVDEECEAVRYGKKP